jgi:TP901 family phage tail tape measure protein
MAAAGLQRITAGSTGAATAVGRLDAAQRAAFNAAGVVRANSEAYSQLGSTLTRVGAAGVAGLGLLGAAAISWESDWAGVTKTVSGSAPQMDALEASLRNLATTLPSSHTEIAGVAEAAGQLGVKSQEVAQFTKVMVQLGTTTNLSADEASTSLAQFMNIMGTAGPNVERLGSTIVALGNSGASTERDIVQMGQRIAGAGNQIGLSETDVLAFASAIASTGVEAEAGGTAVSQSFKMIDTAVRSGGQGLELIARTAGMTGQQFQTAFRDDAAGAINTFVEGLGKVQAAGGDVNAVLSKLGVTGIREADVLIRLASASQAAGRAQGLLGESLKTGRDAWAANTALAAEAQKRYETAGARIQIAWNTIKDAAITAGGALAPVAATVADGIAKMTTAISKAPQSVQTMGVAFLASGAGMALLAGGALKAASGITTLQTAFRGLGLSASASGKAMRTAGASIPVVGLALFGVTTAIAHFASKSADSTAAAGDFAAAIASITGELTRENAAMNENVRLAAVNALQNQGALDTASRLGLSLKTVADAALGNKTAMAQVNAVLSENLALNPQLSKANSDRYNDAVSLSKVLNSTSRQEQGALRAAQQRQEAMAGAGAASKSAAESMAGVRSAAAAEASAIQTAREALLAYTNQALALSGSSRGVQSAINSAGRAAKDYVAAMVAKADADGKSKKAAKENAEAAIESGKAFHGTSDASLALQASLDGIAAASSANVDNLVKIGASSDKIAQAQGTAKRAFLDAADAMGVGAGEANRMADAYFSIPREVNTKIAVAGAKLSVKEADDLNAALKDIPPESRARIITIAETKGAKAAKLAMEQVKDKVVIARSKGDLKGAKQVDAAMKALKDRLVKAVARGDKKGADAVREAMARLKDRQVIARAKGDTKGAKDVKSAMAALKDRLVKATARGDTSGARAVQSAMNALRNKTVTVTVKRVESGNMSRVATGGLITEAGVFRAAGGSVPGWSPHDKADNIPAMLTAREFVQPVDSVDYYGLAAMQAIQKRRVPKEALAGYADGGPVGAMKLAAGGQVPLTFGGRGTYGVTLKTLTDINRKLVAVNNPLLSVAANFRRVQQAQAELVAVQRRAKHTTEQVRAAQDKLRTATEGLGQAQAALADAARTISASLRDAAATTSTDPQDVLAKRKETAVQLTAFNAALLKLRKAGLNDQDLADIAGRGALDGTELANNILAGGNAMVGALNVAQKQLLKAADDVGRTAAVSVIRRAGGGWIDQGPFGVDRVPTLTTRGEFVVEPKAAAANAQFLEAINKAQGRMVVRGPQGHVGGNVTNRTQSVSIPIHNSGNFGWDADTAARKVQGKIMDAITMSGLAGGI